MPTKKIKTPVASQKIFAQNFKHLLDQRGLTHLEFAKEAKIERHRVERWVNALCFPKYTMMVTICRFFDYYDIYSLLTEPINKK